MSVTAEKVAEVLALPAQDRAFLAHKLIASLDVVEPQNNPTREEFDLLVKQWKSETRSHSSLSKLFVHPAYQRIIGMGMAAVPWILEDLENTPTRWFYALKCMVGTDAAEGATTFQETREKWLTWGRQHNLLS